jgi:hypothetical protein
MNLDRFEQILAAYGAEASGWPRKDAEAARALVENSPEARRLLEVMKRLEGALDGVESFGGISNESIWRTIECATARIDMPARLPSRKTAFDFLGWLKPAGFAMAGVTLFALGLGIGLHSQATNEPAQNAAAKAILEGPYESFAAL